jgi:hypothetical protein
VSLGQHEAVASSPNVWTQHPHKAGLFAAPENFKETLSLMNPRLGVCIVTACMAIAFFAAGCNNNTTTTSTATPAPVTTGPDTLYVQDGGSKTVRVYAHASNLNGVAYPSVTYPTSDTSNPEIIYYEPDNILWYPSAYPSQTYTGVQSTPIKIWTAATTKNGANPDAQAPYSDGAGTAAYDSVHDQLYVANVNGATIQVYSNAHLMTSVSLPAASVTLVITDPGVVGTPRPQDMLYDPVNDRLFVSDEGTVVAVFDAFGASALSGGSRTANRQIIGLYSPDGLAYSAGNDVLYIGEIARRQLNIIHRASSFNGPAGHAQVIDTFSTGPTGLAYDGPHDLLFIYDPLQIWVVPAPAVASGNVNNITNRHLFFDATTELVGFGMSVDPVH